MPNTHICGVDPGLVHTGLVSLLFLPESRSIQVRSFALPGRDAAIVAATINPLRSVAPKTHVFVEKFQPRAMYKEDPEMVRLLGDLRHELPGASVLLNTGVKKVVKRPLMELLGVWSFATTTHHQDLRSAARIGIYGMLKDPYLNRVVADVVRDHLEGRTWHVATH